MISRIKFDELTDKIYAKLLMSPEIESFVVLTLKELGK